MINAIFFYFNRYSLITFGTDSTVVQRFERTDPSPEDLKQLIQGLPQSQGPPDLDEVLDSAKNIFEGAGLRPNAMKVGSVLVDILGTSVYL